jgi:hypothetical protein
MSSSRAKHEEKLQTIRNRLKPLLNKELKQSAMKHKVISYYRQLQGNEPLGRIERGEWEQSQRNLKNKVPNALEAFKAAKYAIRTGTRIVEPRKRIVLSSASKTNKNKNKAPASASVSASATKKNRSFLNIVRNAARAIINRLVGKTKKNHKA